MSEAFAEFQKLLKGRRFRDASALAEREQLRASPKDVFWLTQQAVALSRASDYSQALEAARRALSIDSASPWAIIATADALLGLQRTEEALAHYREVLPNPRLAARARRGALECFIRLKRWEEGLSLTGQWAMPAAEALPWKVKALAGSGRNDEALDACRTWLEASPDNPQALWELTELEVRRDGLEAVLERLGRTLKIPSLPPVYHEIYASLCRRAGKPESALREYEKIAASGAQAKIQRKQAFTLARSGREREAIPFLEELLRADPRDVYLHSSYQAACKRIGEVPRAVSFYEALLEANPDLKGLHGRIRSLRRALAEPS